MSALRASLAVCAVIACSGPAFAFKNLQACDIVAFASDAAPISIAPDVWQAYHDKALTILGAPDAGAADALRDTADRLVEAQDRLLEPVAESDAYKAYLAGDRCLLLRSLSGEGVEAALAAVDPSTPKTAIGTARAIAQAARSQVDMISRSARFRSNRDQALLSARYYCFAAGTIHALLSPAQQAAVGLANFGATVTCKDAGRPE